MFIDRVYIFLISCGNLNGMVVEGGCDFTLSFREGARIQWVSVVCFYCLKKVIVLGEI